MTKRTAIVLLAIIALVTVFFGTFSVLSVEYGEYSKYDAPISILQKSALISDSVVATYNVKLDENVDFSSVKSVIKSRFADAYGYYGIDVKYDENTNVASVVIPKTSNDNNINETALLGNVLMQGKLEVLNVSANSQSPQYSASSVILTSEHISSVNVRSYTSSGSTYYICTARLTKEGRHIAEEKLSANGAYLYAVDGNLTNAVVYTGSSLQLYSQDKASSKLIASYANHGAIGATLTLDQISDAGSNAGLVVAIILGAILFASFVYFVVRFKAWGISAILAQLIAVIVVVYGGAIIGLQMINLYALVAIVIAYAFMTYFSNIVLEKIKQYVNAGKTSFSASYKAFADCNKINLIAHAILLVLSIILWIIPTSVTAPVGNVLLYFAIVSFVATMALNRLFVAIVGALQQGSKAKQ